jgi:hypothetical protein
MQPHPKIQEYLLRHQLWHWKTPSQKK